MPGNATIPAMKRRPLFILPKAALEAMPTRQLLARLRALQRCEESPLLSDRSPEEWQALPDNPIFFKASPVWKLAYAEVKAILAGREHVQR